MATICLVGHDAAPSGCFRLLADSLGAQGHTVVAVLGYGKPINASEDDLEAMIKKTDLLILGMSSAPEFAAAEIAAGTAAKKHGVRYGFYSDMPLCPLRARPGAWLSPLADEARFVCGLLAEGNELGQIFPQAQFLHTGNPLRDKAAFPKHSREEVRAHFGIEDDVKLILAPGGKFAMGNGAVWLMLAEALAQTRYSDKTVVIVSPHPGDPALRGVDGFTTQPLSLYENMIEYFPQRALYITGQDGYSTLDIVPGADLVVEFTGSASVAAAYLRIPVINLTPLVWLRCFAEESGREAVIETVALGAAVHVPFSSPVLTSAIDCLLETTPERRALQERQGAAYPLPKHPDASLEKLVEAVVSQLG